MSDESKITTTLKLEGLNAPWYVLRTDSVAETDALLREISATALGASSKMALDALQATFNANAVLGAVPMEAPVQHAQAPAVQQYIQSATAQAPAAPVYQQPAAPAAPAYQAPQAPQGNIPGAPFITALGVPAKLIEGQKNGRTWRAWADPRSKQETEGMQNVDDPNSPLIAQGMGKFWQFIKG